MSKQKTIAIQTALSALKLKGHKDDMVAAATGGRTTHVSEMTLPEKEAFLQHLNGIQTPNKKELDLLDKKRKRIISTYRQMGFELYDEEKGQMVADMIRIRFDIALRWGRELNNLNSVELGKIIAVLEEKILPWYLSNKE